MMKLALAAALVLLASFAFSPGNLPGIPICPMQAHLDLPCPGCGLTRAFCAISDGDLPAAWGHNPFSFLLYPATLVALAGPILGRRLPTIVRRVSRGRLATVAPVLLVAGMWLYGIARLAAQT